MWENLLFSINIVLPLFLVMFLGLYLRKKNIMTQEFVKNGNALAFKIMLPVSLFLSTSSVQLNGLMDIKFIVFIVSVTLVSFVATWVLAEIFIKDKTIIGSFVQASFRGNFAFLGLPLAKSIVGEENIAKSALVLAIVIPIYNVLSIVVLTIRGQSNKKFNPKEILLSIITNPIIIGIVVGVLFSAFRIPLPTTIAKTAKSLAELSTPLALICLGGSINVSEIDPKFKFALGSALIKVVVQPLVFLPLAYVLGFSHNDMVILLVMLGVPAAISSYAMAIQMKSDGYVASMSVVLSTFLSVFTLTAFIYVFRVLGFV